MCDYSLHHVSSRPARVADKLVTTELARSSTRGFAAVGELGAKLVIHDSPPGVAVCLLPGTELAFDDDVRYDRAFSFFGKARVNHKVASFRQIDVNDPHVQHDALEFPNGQVLKVTQLVAGQTATVLQLPVATQHSEHVETGFVARSSDSRVALNRVAVRPGMASILMPNQGAVMLWRTFRSTAIRLSIALVQSFRRLTVHKQHPLPAGVDAEKIEASFKKGELTVTLPKKPAAQKPEKKVEVKAAA
ncbi:MAG TPA: Hsp20 family protein [Tepidisphaeraceae bacterium]